MFITDNWESKYFMIFWISWNWPSYSRECLWYWLHWHLVTVTSSLPVKHANVCIVVLPMMNVNTCWNSTLVLIERNPILREFTSEWLQHPDSSHYRPLVTTQDEWTIVTYVMEVLTPFRYWTLWMLKRHTFCLHQVLTLYNDGNNHIDGVMRSWAKKKSQLKEKLFFAVK